MAKEPHTYPAFADGCAAGYAACNESRSSAAVMPGKISLSSDSDRIFTNKNAPAHRTRTVFRCRTVFCLTLRTLFTRCAGHFPFADHACRTVRFYFRYPLSVLKLSFSQASICTTAKYRACRRPPSESPRVVRQVRTAGLL